MEDEWIDVNVILPYLPENRNYSDTVLVAASGKTYPAFFSNNGLFYIWRSNNGAARARTPLADKLRTPSLGEDLMATHWMPMPEPPR